MRKLVAFAALAATSACAPVDYCDGSSTVAKDSAVLAAHDLIKEQLRSPASAQGPTSHKASGVSVALTGQCRWTISSYVDSQNGFGAMLRTRYLAVVRAEGDGRYSLENVYFNG